MTKFCKQCIEDNFSSDDKLTAEIVQKEGIKPVKSVMVPYGRNELVERDVCQTDKDHNDSWTDGSNHLSCEDGTVDID